MLIDGIGHTFKNELEIVAVGPIMLCDIVFIFRQSQNAHVVLFAILWAVPMGSSLVVCALALQQERRADGEDAV